MKLAPALSLALLPLTCGCGLMEVELEPVFTPALWDRGPVTVVEQRTVEGPQPVALERAARTGDGVWHALTRFSDGTTRHHAWDAAHPGLHRQDRQEITQEMARWASPAQFPQAPLVPCLASWPEQALQLPVLATPGAELPAPAPALALEARPAGELFVPLAEAVREDEGPGTTVRLAADRQALEVWTPDGWTPLARFPRQLEQVPVERPAPRPRYRVVQGVVKAGLTPATVALDAGYLSVVGAGKLAVAALAVPALIVFFTLGGKWC